jgi:hypothetical protein
LGPNRVVFRHIRVLVDRSIDLENHTERWAIQVDEKSIDDLLATELEIKDTPVAYQTPRMALRRCGISPEVSRKFELARINRL